MFVCFCWIHGKFASVCVCVCVNMHAYVHMHTWNMGMYAPTHHCPPPPPPPPPWPTHVHMYTNIMYTCTCSADDLNKYFVATPDHPTMLSCDSSQATSTVTRQSNVLRLSATGQNDVFRFRPIKRDDVLTHLQNLNESKATGLDGISAKLLKLSAPAIAQDLCDIFNHSLTTSQIPACWKEAKVTPIPKVLGASSPEQFRPISVIPVVARVFESLVFQQLYSYVSGSGLLHWAQSGFRPHHCTQDVLLKVTDDWRASID